MTNKTINDLRKEDSIIHDTKEEDGKKITVYTQYEDGKVIREEKFSDDDLMVIADNAITRQWFGDRAPIKRFAKKIGKIKIDDVRDVVEGLLIYWGITKLFSVIIRKIKGNR